MTYRSVSCISVSPKVRDAQIVSYQLVW